MCFYGVEGCERFVLRITQPASSSRSWIAGVVQAASAPKNWAPRSNGGKPSCCGIVLSRGRFSFLGLNLLGLSDRLRHFVRVSTGECLAEVPVTAPMVRAILAVIHRLRGPRLCAWLRPTPKLNVCGRTGLPVALKNTPRARTQRLPGQISLFYTACTIADSAWC